jgi:hypothetical protein
MSIPPVAQKIGLAVGVVGTGMAAVEAARRFTRAAYHVDARSGGSIKNDEWTNKSGVRMESEQTFPPFGAFIRTSFWFAGPIAGGIALSLPKFGMGAWSTHNATRIGALLVTAAGVGGSAGATWAWMTTVGTRIREVPGIPPGVHLEPEDRDSSKSSRPERPATPDKSAKPTDSDDTDKSKAEPEKKAEEPKAEKKPVEPEVTTPENTSTEDVDETELEIEEDGFAGQDG